MKANRHYTEQKGKLNIMETKIDSKVCCKVAITYTVDARHILLAITCLTSEDNPSRKTIEKVLKDQLSYSGEGWYDSPINYGEEGSHYNLREELKKAVPIAKKFFPEFMGVPNSIKFIKDLA